MSDFAKIYIVFSLGYLISKKSVLAYQDSGITGIGLVLVLYLTGAVVCKMLTSLLYLRGGAWIKTPAGYDICSFVIEAILGIFISSLIILS